MLICAITSYPCPKEQMFPRKLENLAAILSVFVRTYNQFGIEKVRFASLYPNSSLPFSLRLSLNLRLDTPDCIAALDIRPQPRYPGDKGQRISPLPPSKYFALFCALYGGYTNFGILLISPTGFYIRRWRNLPMSTITISVPIVIMFTGHLSNLVLVCKLL